MFKCLFKLQTNLFVNTYYMVIKTKDIFIIVAYYHLGLGLEAVEALNVCSSWVEGHPHCHNTFSITLKII